MIFILFLRSKIKKKLNWEKINFFLPNPTLIYIYVKPHKRVIKVIFKEKNIIKFIYWIYLVKLNFFYYFKYLNCQNCDF